VRQFIDLAGHMPSTTAGRAGVLIVGLEVGLGHGHRAATMMSIQVRGFTVPVARLPYGLHRAARTNTTGMLSRIAAISMPGVICRNGDADHGVGAWALIMYRRCGDQLAHGQGNRECVVPMAMPCRPRWCEFLGRRRPPSISRAPVAEIIAVDVRDEW